MLNDYKAKKYEYNGKKLTDYECSQMQRGYERKSRETKRQLTACNAAMRETDDEALKSKLKMEFDDQSVRLKSQEKELRDFCKQTKRRVDSSRTQVYAVKDDQGRIRGFDRSVSQKAVWANRKIQRVEDIIGTKTKDGIVITGFSDHVKNRMAERGVDAKSVEDALMRPIKIGKIKTDKSGRKNQEYIGEKARVYINPDTGNIITTWKTGSRILRKLGVNKNEN